MLKALNSCTSFAFSRIVPIIVLSLFILPIAALLISVFEPISEDFRHLSDTVLPGYIWNSIFLLLGVGGLTFLIGTSAAWLLSNFEFSFSRFFSWAMVLPLAFPTYVVAFIYAGIFEYSGPVQEYLREVFSWSKGDYWFFEIRSLGGVIVVLSLVLYPYVYMVSRVAFMNCRDVVNIGRSLGLSSYKIFWKIALPSIRPAIAAGVALACMEALSDFGAVQHFAVDTFTTGIYRSWFGMYNSVVASKLAVFLMMFVFIILFLERFSRKDSRYENVNYSQTTESKIKLSGYKNILALLVCFLPFALGFLMPFTQLVLWSYDTAAGVIDDRFLGFIFNSVQVSGIATIVTVIIALIFSYNLRFSLSGKTRPGFSALPIRITSMGYAVPGSVLAVGVLVSFSWLDENIKGYFSSNILLSGTIFALIFAYVFRFLAIGLGNLEPEMEKITDEVNWTAKLFGLDRFKILTKVHAPFLYKGILSACLLVFVEGIKELPATLIIRPFNFETLATRTYELASDERLADSSSSALMIVAISIIPVLLLSRIFSNKISQKA